eukprot:93307-Chlamydomonas_euryale.AAC.8
MSPCERQATVDTSGVRLAQRTCSSAATHVDHAEAAVSQKERAAPRVALQRGMHAGVVGEDAPSIPWLGARKGSRGGARAGGGAQSTAGYGQPATQATTGPPERLSSSASTH